MSLLTTAAWFAVYGTAALLTVPETAREDTGYTPGSTPAVKLEERLSTGMRIVILEDLPDRDVYIPVSPDTARKYRLRKGNPGGRIEYAHDNRFVVLKSPPEQGVTQQSLMQTDLPNERGDKLLCIIAGSPGKLFPVFVDDSRLTPGTSLLINATKNRYLLEFLDAPEGTESSVMLDPGIQYIFNGEASDPNRRRSTTHGVILKHKVRVKGRESDWLINRRFMLTSSRTKAIIKIMVDSGHGTMMMHDIYLYPERNVIPGGTPSR